MSANSFNSVTDNSTDIAVSGRVGGSIATATLRTPHAAGSANEVIEIQIAPQRSRTAVRAVKRADRQLLWQLLFSTAEDALAFAIRCETSDAPVTAHKACELAG